VKPCGELQLLDGAACKRLAVADLAGDVSLSRCCAMLVLEHWQSSAVKICFLL
jgi:hypothetical protein